MNILHIMTILPCTLSLILWLLLCSRCWSDSVKSDDMKEECWEQDATVVHGVGGQPPTCVRQDPPSSSRNAVPDDCQLVYAKILDEDADNGGNKEEEWGVFTIVPRKKGSPVRKYGDVIIQWTDPPKRQTFSTLEEEDILNKDHDHHRRRRRRGLLEEFTWNGQETGGHDEGRMWVESVVTGLGMMARSTSRSSAKHNILPLVPRVDEGGLTRFDSPGAGAITQYHNYTWWFSKDVAAGEELVYSSNGKKSTKEEEQSSKDRNIVQPTPVSLDYLTQNGYCIDNLMPQQSRVKEAGRGAFATRILPEGSIVAPVPIVPIKRDDLMGKDAKRNPKEQLLLNYCFGHSSSEWVLFPFSPVINLINHWNEPNVKIQWSAKSLDYIHQLNSAPQKISNEHTLLLELVAIKPIRQGDEIYLDYGRVWEDAWWHHSRDVWRPINEHYTPSYVMDDAIRLLRTEQEQKEHPYPNNVFTSCFYRYSDRTEEERAMARMKNKKDSSSLDSFRWQITKGLYDLKNLRPCQVLKRLEDSKGRSAYAVRMLNRPGLDEMERIPNDQLHIVTHVPRAAIRFSDKAGSTDQHLPDAFRHEIGLPEDLILLLDSWWDRESLQEKLPRGNENRTMTTS